ncbi:AI-2E family transporter [Falsiroseomonas sp.]|uniref:AI-2E family transporter n=1 Tax=Falsiroseomonas sp. TaxID=2870721 RepID=UPI0035682BD1
MRNTEAPGPAEGGWRGEVAFLRRTLIVAGVVILLLLAWTVRHALLMGFAALLVAVLLRMLADPLRERLGVPGGWSVAAACLVVALPIALALWLAGSEMREQLGLLLEQLPEAAETLEREFGLPIPGAGEADPGSLLDASVFGTVAGRIASFALATVDALAGLVIVVVGGIYFAGDPATYRRGLARLLPRAQQALGEEALAASGNALRLWLTGQLMAMAVVGTLTGLGTWAIGLPAPLALGLLAGLANIVPLLGAFIGAVPGVLLAINLGWETLAWTVALYLAVQQLEGNVLTPMVGERMVSIPPGLLLISLVAAGAALGIGGVLLAAPLTVVMVVLVSKLYVQETLGKPVEVPGEKAGEDRG